MKYEIRCQDCNGVGRVILPGRFWGKSEKPCPTCKGTSMVPYGTTFNRGYEQLPLTADPLAKHVIRSTYVPRDTSDDSNRTDDGFGTMLVVAAIASSDNNAPSGNFEPNT